jgi:nucleoid-associated protein YgaU
MVGDTRIVRCGAVWAATTLGAAALLPWLAAGLPTVPPDDVVAGLVAGSTAAAVGCLTWLWVLTTLVVLDVLRGRPTGPHGVPPALRRWVLVACGVSLAGGLLPPAYAERGTSEPSRPAASTLLVGLPVPDRATTTTQWLGLLARPREHPGSAVVVVAAGDTLWDLATHTLPVTADDAEIQRRWREIYRANRDVVGADPDLIRPGQRLSLPASRPDQETHS